MIRVLFVCLGNICRSPMAEGIMRDRIQKAGLSDKIEVDSAGTGGWHVGQTPHRGTLDILKKHNIEYQGRARQIEQADYDKFDYIVTMDKSNLRRVQSSAGQTNAEIALFLSYADTDTEEVPDPYYDDNFEYVYTLVSQGVDGLLAKIRKDHNL